MIGLYIFKIHPNVYKENFSKNSYTQFLDKLEMTAHGSFRACRERALILLTN